MADLFAIPDFWKPPASLDHEAENREASVLFTLAVTDSVVPADSLQPAPQLASSDFFRLPPVLEHDLSKDHHASEREDHLNHDEQTLAEAGLTEPDDVLLDPWISSPVDLPQAVGHFRTWAEFERPDKANSAPLFVTEAGPAAFDEHLSSGAVDDAVLDAKSYCACLLALALGRVSVLFSWDDAARSFRQTIPRARISGYSCETLEGVRDRCLRCGNSTHFLRCYTKMAYSRGTNPYQIAMARTAEDLLRIIQAELGERSRTIQSILQLESLVEPVQMTLGHVEELVKRTTRNQDDGALLSALFEEAQDAEYRQDILRDITKGFLRAVSRPWLDFIEEWVGMRPDEISLTSGNGPGSNFVRLSNTIPAEGMDIELEEEVVILDIERMPQFVSEDLVHTLTESGQSLRFLRENHPDHVLLQPDVIRSCKPPALQWQFAWDDIARLEEQILAYEMAVLEAIQQARRQTPQPNPSSTGTESSTQVLEFFGKSSVQMEERLELSLKELDRSITETKTAGGLTSAIKSRLFLPTRQTDAEAAGGFAPDWSLIPMLSFAPLVNAQSRIVNHECMRLLFTAHKLREHIQLQHEFQLLGNGLFCVRLSDALFDPDADSATRQAGVALTGGTMGLRLGSRDNWPPASSELRLALMGVLSESYRESQQRGERNKSPAASRRNRVLRTADSELPGEMSFAVRDLPPDEIERCMDPDALEALDFLRLSYKPPPPLRAIMTPAILDKYDRVFRALMRVLRVLFVAKQLFRDVLLKERWSGAESTADLSSEDEQEVHLRFRFEAHHFVSRVAAYFLNVGVGAARARFDAWLDGVESSLATTPVAGTGNAQSDNLAQNSPDRLRRRHDAALDEIMLALLLRKRQQPVLKLLEDIFNIVLQFARAVGHRQTSTGSDDGGDVAVEQLYASFRKKVEVFLTVCRGLADKGSMRDFHAQQAAGVEDGQHYGQENSIVQLVAMLDLSGYYSGLPPP